MQIKYRFIYLFGSFRKRCFGTKEVSDSKFKKTTETKFSKVILSHTSWSPGNQFTFLNISESFSEAIDWNFIHHGKLWVYNLNYFEYLNQENFSVSEGKRLIYDFIGKADDLRDGAEPFPTSLRILNWVKFLASWNISDDRIDQSLYSQLCYLRNNLEYHLLGNHLLENGFALLFGGIYFEDEEIIREAESILNSQLSEQILDDGGHFERSPMYHQLMLFRVLDSLNLIKSNKVEVSTILVSGLEQSAAKMIAWLRQISYANGEIPLFSDSAVGIAPTSNQLYQYVEELNIQEYTVGLSSSGYRKVSNSNFELIMNLGKIGPSYQPGHAHSDTFNFELRLKGTPFIVDTGISTYEKNDIRKLERSTSSHNTVKVGEYEQNEVWGGFRVARRATPSILESTDFHVSVEHDGYEKVGAIHARTFSWSENKIDIIDRIKGNGHINEAHLHFHPSVELSVSNSDIQTNFGKVVVEDQVQIRHERYQYALGFNMRIQADKLIFVFERELKVSITW